MKKIILLLILTFTLIVSACQSEEIQEFEIEDVRAFLDMHDARIPINEDAKYIHVWTEKYKGEGLPEDLPNLEDVSPVETNKIITIHLNDSVIEDFEDFLLAVNTRSEKEYEIFTGIKRDEKIKRSTTHKLVLESSPESVGFKDLSYITNNTDKVNNFYSLYFYSDETEVNKIITFNFVFSNDEFSM